MAKLQIFNCDKFEIEYDEDILKFNISFEPFIDTRINNLIEYKEEYDLLVNLYDAIGNTIKKYKKLKGL